MNVPEPAPDLSGRIELPPEVQALANGQLRDQSPQAWAEFDLDESNRFVRRYLVLTLTHLIVLGEGEPRLTAIEQVREAATVEDLGFDRLRLSAADSLIGEFRYSRRCRRGVSRLLRKLKRRLPAGERQPAAPAPEWLDAVEREAERKEQCPKCERQIPAYAEGVCPHCLQKKTILWRLLGTARPYRARIVLALALTLAVSLLATAPPVLIRSIIDDSIGRQHLSSLWKFGGLLVLTIVVSEALGGLRMYTLATVGTWVTRDLRHAVYRQLHDLSLRYFAKRRTGSLITRVTSDTDRLWDFIVFGSVNVIRDLAMIFFVACVMFALNWRLALVSLAPLPLLALITWRRSRLMGSMFGRLWMYWARMGAVVGDALPGVRVVKAFANEKREVERFDDRNDEYAAKEQGIHKVWTTMSPLVSGLMRLSSLFILLVGGYMVIEHPSPRNSLGTLIAFTQFVHQFYHPIMELANSSRMIVRAATSAQRVFEVLDTPPEIFSRNDPIVKDGLQGRVEFRGVGFSYEGQQPALSGVSICVNPGEMIGLCGPSGAGKSTFVNLICRFYDVTDGQILIDGVDVRDYDVQWLRRQIGVVLQEPYLFHGTIAENIRYGNPHATNAQVVAAARAANAHDFIVGFPDGYDTLVGERGQSLSGGERQRVSIARAILHNPRILILDEATSSVDSSTEKQIQEAMDRLVRGRTTFAIAHRLSTLKAATRLVVLDKGRIVEEGTHDQLLAREDGVFARLHRQQMERGMQVAV